MAQPTGIVPAELECIHDAARAQAVLNPLRLEILSRARTPRSGSEIAAELGLGRQAVNYHVRALERASFLRKAGRRRKRNFYEQRYVASARAYIVAPSVLGPVQVEEGTAADRFSAERLIALAARVQSDLAAGLAGAADQKKRLPTLSISVDLRFESAAQRARFAGALADAVARVVAEHASPAFKPDGAPGRGRPYRLVAGCYPVPAAAERAHAPEERS
jgi:DNA-binding transcriptional ArsR family regulator